MDFLANGSVVLINNKEGNPIEIMIIGRLLQNGENGEIQDYVGVPYPYGFVGAKSIIGFNSLAIQKVVHLGYESELELDIRDVLKEKYESVKNV